MLDSTSYIQEVCAYTKFVAKTHPLKKDNNKMATPKRVEVLPQKGKLVNPYNHVNIVKDEEPSDFMVKSISRNLFRRL